MPRAQARPISRAFARGVLMDGEQAGNAAAAFEFAADQMARALGGDEQHIDIF